MSIIYKTTNLITGKIYIGKAKVDNPLYLGSGTKLAHAIKKYGRGSFKREILEECDDREVDNREIFWISHFNSTNRNIGYNITNGGAGGDTTTNHPDKDSVIKSRASSIKEWHSNLTEDEKIARGQKISSSKKGKSNGHKGLKHSEKTKQLIKENQPTKTEAWKESHAKAMAMRKGKPFTKKYKPVIVNGIEYQSVKHAVDALGFKHRATFYTKVKQGLIKLEYK